MSKLPDLEARLRSRSARAGVVGLGHAGLPLAVEIARAGFAVTGIDTDPARVEDVQTCRPYVPDVEREALERSVHSGQLRASGDYAALAECNAISICVPTPLRKTKDPDLTSVVASTKTLATHVRPGTLVILESTTYPGTTEEAVVPILQDAGLRVGEDLFVCYSPERVDPANPRFRTRNIPKVIGGVTPSCLRAGELYYGCIMDRVIPVSSTLVAETAKLLENTFRMVNIGLANETAVLCDRLGIDVWEVIDAAATKPFGFMPFYPGPGLGGHCVPVDPHFLAWKSKQVGYEPRLIQLAAEINGAMPRHVIALIQSALNDQGKPVRGSRVHLVGVAYKRNVADTRESPALDIAALLAGMGAEVSFSDPSVSRLRVGALEIESSELTEAARQCDIAVVLADHDGVNYGALLEAAPLVLDTRNVFKGVSDPHLRRL